MSASRRNKLLSFAVGILIAAVIAAAVIAAADPFADGPEMTLSSSEVRAGQTVEVFLNDEAEDRAEDPGIFALTARHNGLWLNLYLLNAAPRPEGARFHRTAREVGYLTTWSPYLHDQRFVRIPPLRAGTYRITQPISGDDEDGLLMTEIEVVD
jgi:hypothetical protein